MTPIRLFVVFTGLLCWSTSNHALLLESGNLLDEIQNQRNLTFVSGSGLYAAPDAGERAAFRALAASLYQGNIGLADTQAAALNYDVVEYSSNVSGDTFFGLREQLVAGVQTRGWGSYYLRDAATASLLLEVNHPRFDTNSWDIAGQAFQNSGAAGFLMAGAHRNANGSGTADTAHLVTSVFQEVHEVWSDLGNHAAWSIYGFAIT